MLELLTSLSPVGREEEEELLVVTCGRRQTGLRALPLVARKGEDRRFLFHCTLRCAKGGNQRFLCLYPPFVA